MTTPTTPEQQIRTIIEQYYAGRDSQQNLHTLGVVAFTKVQQALGMQWVEGEETERRKTQQLVPQDTPIAKVKAAIQDYYLARDEGKNIDDARLHAFQSIEGAMNMRWIPGASPAQPLAQDAAEAPLSGVVTIRMTIPDTLDGVDLANKDAVARAMNIELNGDPQQVLYIARIFQGDKPETYARVTAGKLAEFAAMYNTLSTISGNQAARKSAIDPGNVKGDDTGRSLP